MSQNSLSILLQTDPAVKDTLKEEWGYVIDNYMKSTISGLFKNTDLSGNPTAGVLQAKRFANATNASYGTARANRAASKVKVLPVTVEINDNQEWLEEVEEKDLTLYGVEGLVTKRTQNQTNAVERYFERKFFYEGVLSADAHTFTATDIEDKLEEIIQKLETVQNDFVDGIDRADMVLVLDPSTYGAARNLLDTVSNPNVDSSIEEFKAFHGVLTFSSIYLPATVNYLIMRKEAIAQPIRLSVYDPKKVELSDATAFGAFTYSGTKSVTPDLIFFAGTIGTVTATSTAGATTNTSVIKVASAPTNLGNTFWYKAHATAVAAAAYGADAEDEDYIELELVGGEQTITFATQTKLRVVEVDAVGRIIKTTTELTITKGS